MERLLFYLSYSQEIKDVWDGISPGRRGQRWGWLCPSGPGSAASHCRWTLCTLSGYSSCVVPPLCGSAKEMTQNMLMFISHWERFTLNTFPETTQMLCNSQKMEHQTEFGLMTLSKVCSQPSNNIRLLLEYTIQSDTCSYKKYCKVAKSLKGQSLKQPTCFKH